jgi:hypothetical protein
MKGDLKMRFIRIDQKGTWRGKEHRSCIAGSVFTTEETIWEDGISCYNLNDKVDAIENLYNYWTRIAMATLEDFKDMDVTIFEGYKLDTWGADGEDLAICTKTIIEADAYEFMKKVYDAKYKLEGLYENENGEYEEITEKEYREILQSLISD